MSKTIATPSIPPRQPLCPPPCKPSSASSKQNEMKPVVKKLDH